MGTGDMASLDERCALAALGQLYGVSAIFTYTYMYAPFSAAQENPALL